MNGETPQSSESRVSRLRCDVIILFGFLGLGFPWISVLCWVCSRYIRHRVVSWWFRNLCFFADWRVKWNRTNDINGSIRIALSKGALPKCETGRNLRTQKRSPRIFVFESFKRLVKKGPIGWNELIFLSFFLFSNPKPYFSTIARRT